MNRNKFQTTQEKNTDEKPNYKLRAAIAGLAVGGSLFLGHNALSNDAPEEKFETTLSSSTPFTLEQGDTVIDKALEETRFRTGDELPYPNVTQEPLTATQQNELVVSANSAVDNFEGTARLIPQPGEMFTIDVGEFDGDEEQDVRVRIGTDPLEPSQLPDYYQDK